MLAEVAGLRAIPDEMTLEQFRNTLVDALSMESGFLTKIPVALDRIIDLQAVPGGWQHLDGLWEFVSGTSLTHACTRDNVISCRLDENDQSTSFRFSLKAVHYAPIDDQDDEGNELYFPTEFNHFKISNNLEDVLRAIPKILGECDSLSGKKVADNGYWHHFQIYDRGARLCYVPLNYNGEPDTWDERDMPVWLKAPLDRYAFDPASIHVVKPDPEFMEALDKVFGHQATEMLTARKLEVDLGL